MHRILKNIYSRKRTDVNCANDKKQRNVCVKLLRKTKNDYFQTLNIRDFSDNKKFWKTVKPYFSNKGLKSNKLFHKEKGNLVSNEKQLATKVSNFCINITKDLELKEDNSSNVNTLKDVAKVSNAYPSVERARKNIDIFSASNRRSDLVLNLDSFKTTSVGDIPVDMHFPFITKIINLSFKIFFQKISKVSPVFKRKAMIQTKNYRPVSVLSHVSKVFERIVYYQIDNFMKDKLSNLLTGFRKNHRIQYCLMYMFEMWKDTLDKGDYVSAMFICLSKAFDTVNYDLLITK